ncbi:MAG: hypothetical protein CVU54_01275 [Deltaproteobacteria bacterium HGW-Deltaproteobacteria-12]|jgi:hypothetical protein|nr:MAG: hypothetical protein CVU54_01275 [Deltaproteobacteria bacterium HGW-Deltaproteobacteria-12]
MANAAKRPQEPHFVGINKLFHHACGAVFFAMTLWIFSRSRQSGSAIFIFAPLNVLYQPI